VCAATTPHAETQSRMLLKKEVLKLCVCEECIDMGTSGGPRSAAQEASWAYSWDSSQLFAEHSNSLNEVDS
jgi:hypothetical protein